MEVSPQTVKIEYSVDEPLNREPPVQELVSRYKNAYDRNHGPIPLLDKESYRVRVDGNVSSPLSLSVDQLSSLFPQHTVTCALQCAGNRRHTMRTLLKEVDGIDWGDGAVMNCSWRGPRLRDVLRRADVTMKNEGKWHVAFASYHTKVQDDDWYGGSIELKRGLSEDGEVILALEMNSEPLPAHHGAPVRIIAPGIAGARSVKWLSRITVQSSESENFYQKRDYKVLPPEATDKKAAEDFWDRTPAIQDMPVNSVIATPRSGDTLRLDEAGTIGICGYALPQGADGPVVKVEVSVDDCKTWKEAELIADDEGKWCWALWKIRIKMPVGDKQCIFSRATDKAGNIQVGHPTWNLRGVAYNGYGESRDLKVYA